MPIIGTLIDLVAGNVNDPEEVDQNFADIRTAFNTYAVLTDVARTVTVQHTFNPSSASAPFLLGANAQSQKVVGLNADLLDGLEAAAFLGATAAAGGDLSGNYPNPVVDVARGLRETAGPTELALGAVADGQFLRREGSTIVGDVAAFNPVANARFF